MFGGFVDGTDREPALAAEARAAFQVLVDSIVEQQRDNIVGAGDALLTARYPLTILV